MRKVLVIVFILTLATGAYAQNAFFPTKAGMQLTYVANDAKGKASGYTLLTVKDVAGSGENMTISYVGESLDKNRKSSKPPVEMSYQVIIKDGVMILDMNQMFSSQQLKDVNVEITGIPVEIPNNLQPGQKLKDANVTMKLDMVIMKMTTEIKITDGECLAIEDVTVPAGTFTSHKITQTVSTTVMKKTVTAKTITWYAPGIGTVKTETYDSKDKLTGSTELIEVKGN